MKKVRKSGGSEIGGRVRSEGSRRNVGGDRVEEGGEGSYEEAILSTDSCYLALISKQSGC